VAATHIRLAPGKVVGSRSEPRVGQVFLLHRVLGHAGVGQSGLMCRARWLQGGGWAGKDEGTGNEENSPPQLCIKKLG